MKITDLLIENKAQVDEAPMGFLKTMGNKVASTFGSGKAQGRLDTGKIANDLRKEFDVYLGKTGQEPTGEMVLGFLKSKGYPTSSASKVLGTTPTRGPADAAQAAPGQAADATPTAEPAAPQAAAKPSYNNQLAGGKQTVSVNGKPAATGAVPKATDPAAAVKAAAQPPKQEPGAAAFGQMAQQLGKEQPKPAAGVPGDDATPTGDEQAAADARVAATGASPAEVAAQRAEREKRIAARAPRTAAPAAAPTAQPAVPARPQGGGKVAGALSTSPTAVAKRQARAVKKRTVHPADDNPNIQLGTESIQRTRTFEQHLNYFRMLAEGLNGKQLDAIFLAAAQEKARTPAAAGQPSPTAGGNAQGGAAPADGSAATAQGGAAGAPLAAPGGKAQPAGDSALDVLKGARDGFKGIDYAKGGDPRNKRLMDPTGRVPDKIVQQINKLSPEDRKKLRAELDKA